MSIRIIQADVIAGLAALGDQSVQCVVTSPPYWGLRDYGVEGQIGLEKTPEEYITKMVEVFREVRRVLRDDGTVWLNLGDCYGTNNISENRTQGNESDYTDAYASRRRRISGINHTRITGLKPKDLVGMPWRLAFALQSDGWYLRSDIIWSKPNPMPESVTDRPTKSHEYVFLLTKKARYFYDADAVREAHTTPLHAPGNIAKYGEVKRNDFGTDRVKEVWGNPAGRNRRTVWEIATQPTPEAHFATFPESLVEPCIKAGTSERGCCSGCGAPWVRVVEREETGERLVDGSLKTSKAGRKRAYAPGSEITSESSCFKTGLWKKNNTLGWQPSCTCGEYVADDGTRKTLKADTIPCTVLDPFGGSGTVAKVARRLHRDAILIEINPAYVEIMKKCLRLNEQLFEDNQIEVIA